MEPGQVVEYIDEYGESQKGTITQVLKQPLDPKGTKNKTLLNLTFKRGGKEHRAELVPAKSDKQTENCYGKELPKEKPKGGK